MMNVQEAKEKLTQLQQKMSAYDHACAILYYDGVTTAPKGTAENRAKTLSVLSEESYKLATGKETVELLEYLDAHKEELNEAEQRMVYLLLKDIRQMRKIPMDEYVAYEELLVNAEDKWHTAKETSDFALFEPYLEKIFETNIRFAHYCAPDQDPYDYWLGEFEDGLNKEKCDAFFDTLRAHIVPLLKKIAEKPQVGDECLHGFFPAEKQEALSKFLMAAMGLDLTHCGLGTTEHPFTTSLGSHLDERITTHYHEDDFSSSLFSVVHESGHALYDMGSREEYCYTVLDGGVSMGVHESQSRFYENLLGRSRAFTAFLLPKLKELFPEEMKDVTEDELYRAVNRVQPSLIRTEADEVTYCLHIMIRYELEKRVMAGELKVHDLPKEWNRLYREYLGVDVPDDRSGVLQDSHWSGGSVGYFPSYALGSAYGAQLLAKMNETVPVEECLRKGDFAPINAWNREHIWQYGSLLAPGKLLENAMKAPFDPTYYTKYLEEKCRDIYGV